MLPLDSLIQLHESNERLKEIQDLKGHLPELLNKLKIELEEITTNQNQNNIELKDLNGKITNQQVTLTDSNDKLEKYNNQLFNVTNTKEYEALILETDQLKELISNLNQEMSDASAKISELEEMIKSNQEEIQNLSSEIAKNKKELSNEMAHTDKEEQALLKNIGQLVQKVDSNYYGQYNKLFNKYGQGMASIIRQSCSHCYNQLPAQMLVEIEYDKKIITCPGCSVFLYHKTEDITMD
tara:strand:- start:498 stop:1214 length:717 start_codon:yes stop_codon:yes gene_type:complete